MRSDDELYSLFLSSDSSAYDELMLRHGDSLTLYLNAYLHDQGDAEDLMIEAFARIMVKRPSIRPGGFKAYLYKTARHLASRFHARTKSREYFDIDDMETLASQGLLPDEELLDSERREILQLCMQRIDPQFREALWLVYFEDMSYAQAAQVIGVSVRRIDRLLQRGKGRLREELVKEGVTHAYG